MEVITKSAQETAALGEKIANQLTINHKQSLLLRNKQSLLLRNRSSIIALTGELGSGKTVFVQGLAKGLGIKERILSPTFIMIRQYPLAISHQSSIISFYHIDLYRIESEKDIEGLSLEEIWSDPKNIVAIEWAEKIKKILPKKRIEIHFEYINEGERRITINSKS